MEDSTTSASKDFEDGQVVNSHDESKELVREADKIGKSLNNDTIELSTFDQRDTCEVILLQEKNTWKLFIWALKYTSWLFLTTLPAILFVCFFALGYSHISWTKECPVNATIPCLYYSTENLVYFDTVVRLVLLCIIPVLVVSISLGSVKYLLRYVLFITLPMTIIVLITIPGMLRFKQMWFYYIDIGFFVALFIVSLTACMFCISKQRVDISLKSLFAYCLLPGIIGALGIAFIDAFVNKKYQSMKHNSIGQYLIRIIFYPIVVDLLISCGETYIQKIPKRTIDRRSHVMYLYQVAFSIIGRYMTTISGSLLGIFVMAGSIAFKDIFLHRMSRTRCWLSYKCRLLFKKICSSTTDVDIDKFREWFCSKEFTSFKANVLNNDFTIELFGVIVVPVVMFTFSPHKLLFHFKDHSFTYEDGSLNYKYIILQESIQVVFLFFTIVVIAMLEAKFNHVSLWRAYKRLTFWEYASQTLIQTWSVLLLLSSVRMTTNFFQCDDFQDICSCDIDGMDFTKYGCKDS